MSLKTVTTARLRIGYLEEGPIDGTQVLLLHGFPDDATCWNSVMRELVQRGHRCIAPYVRGCGPTAFLDAETPRAGDFAALGQDALDLVDALDLRDCIVVGQDWGSPTAEVVAMRRPDRVRRLVKLNWYGVFSMTEMARAQGFHYAQMRTLWYVWMLNTPVGEMALAYDRNGFAKALWEEWSPSWHPQQRAQALESVQASFASDDWKLVALSAYRANLPGAVVDPADDALRQALQQPEPVRCPTVIVHGVDDGVERSPLDDAARRRWFPGGLQVRPLPGVGHFPQREAPDAVVAAITGT